MTLYPGEEPVSLVLAIGSAAVGLSIFCYIVFRLVGDYREAARDEKEEPPSQGDAGSDV